MKPSKTDKIKPNSFESNITDTYAILAKTDKLYRLLEILQTLIESYELMPQQLELLLKNKKTFIARQDTTRKSHVDTIFTLTNIISLIAEIKKQSSFKKLSPEFCSNLDALLINANKHLEGYRSWLSFRDRYSLSELVRIDFRSSKQIELFPRRGLALAEKYQAENNDTQHRTWQNSMFAPDLYQIFQDWKSKIESSLERDSSNPANITQNLFEYAAQSKIHSPNSIKYLTPQESWSYLVNTNQGKLTYETENEQRVIPDDNYIYVMDMTGKFFIAKEGHEALNPNRPHVRLQHPSFTAGRRILCAGTVDVQNGKIVSLSNISGHYIPNIDNMIPLIEELQRRNIFAANAKIQIVGEPTLSRRTAEIPLNLFDQEAKKSPRYDQALHLTNLSINETLNPMHVDAINKYLKDNVIGKSRGIIGQHAKNYQARRNSWVNILRHALSDCTKNSLIKFIIVEQKKFWGLSTKYRDLLEALKQQLENTTLPIPEALPKNHIKKCLALYEQQLVFNNALKSSTEPKDPVTDTYATLNRYHCLYSQPMPQDVFLSTEELCETEIKMKL